MKKFCGLLVILGVLSSPALAAYFVAGSFNGWNPAGLAMTETFPGSGIWSATAAPLGSREEFKITDGTWGWNFPGSGNAWMYSGDGSVTITFDTNVYADGWVNVTNRIGVDEAPGSWTAVGDWQGWKNGNPVTAMVPMGGGIYLYEQDIAPGWWQYKAVYTGTWDAIGADARSVNAETYWFETTAANPHAKFWVDAYAGVIKVEVVPEPAAAVALALLALVARRR